MEIPKDLVKNLPLFTQKVKEMVWKVADFQAAESKNFDRQAAEYKGLNNLVSYVDKESEKILVAACKAILPDAGFLTEEETTASTSDKDLVWIIDPLDGTTNFIHKVPVFSISVGLVFKGRPVLGVICHVPNRQMFEAWEGGGAFCNGEKIEVGKTKTLGEGLLATGFPYFEFEKIENYLRIIHDLIRHSHGLRRMGSAAIDLAYVACGIYEGFFEFNLSPWDVAAGICLVREAGGTVTDFSGLDNALFGREIVAAGPIHAEFLGRIQSQWKNPV
jgi:myo-inositol-1(or 4)-monophosphatase